MALNKILGGAQVQLSVAATLSPVGKLGNVFGPDGGFKNSPLGGALTHVKSNLTTDRSILGTPEELVPLSPAATIKTAAPVSVAVISAPVVQVTVDIAPVGGDPGGDAAAGQEGE